MTDFIGLLVFDRCSLSARLEPTSAFLGAAGMADLTAEGSSVASSSTSQGVIAPLHLVAEAGVRANCGRAPLVQENRIRMLKNGQENYPAWLDAVGATRETLHFESYIIHADDVGYRFADCCARKRARCSLPSGVTGRPLVRGRAGEAPAASGVLAIGSALSAAFTSQQTTGPAEIPVLTVAAAALLGLVPIAARWPRDQRPSGRSGHLDGVHTGSPGTSLVLGVTNKT